MCLAFSPILVGFISRNGEIIERFFPLCIEDYDMKTRRPPMIISPFFTSK